MDCSRRTGFRCNRRWRSGCLRGRRLQHGSGGSSATWDGVLRCSGCVRERGYDSGHVVGDCTRVYEGPATMSTPTVRAERALSLTTRQLKYLDIETGLTERCAAG